MRFLEIKPLTPEHLPSAVELDRLCFGGIWAIEGYRRELESPNSDLLGLWTWDGAGTGTPPLQVRAGTHHPPPLQIRAGTHHPPPLQIRAGTHHPPPLQIRAGTGTPPLQIRAGTGTPPLQVRAGTGTPPLQVRAGTGTPPLQVRAGTGTPPLQIRAGTGTPPLQVPPTLIGIGCLWAILEEAHIIMLAIHPQFQRQGLGQALLLALLQSAHDRQLERSTLEVRESNLAAVSLYKKFGFKEAGRRKRYYEDTGEDALVMWRSGLEKPEFQQYLAVEKVQMCDRLNQKKWHWAIDNFEL